MNEKVIIQVPSVLSLLGIAFIVLKLCNVINWSWIIVLMPFWLPVLMFISTLIIALILLLLVYLFKK